MKRSLIVIGLGVCLAGLAVAEDAAKPAKPNRERPGQHGAGFLIPQGVLADLKLSPEQEAKYKELQAKFDKEREALTAGHQDETMELRKQMKAAEEAKDEAKIAELRKKLEEFRKPMMELRMKYLKELRAILTPEQQAKLDEAGKNMPGRHGGRPGQKRGEAPKN